MSVDSELIMFFYGAHCSKVHLLSELFSVWLQQVYQAGSSIAQTESDVSIHQVESHLLGTVEPEIIFSGLVAHRDYYILHRGTVLKHVDREDAYVKVLLLNGELH